MISHYCNTAARSCKHIDCTRSSARKSCTRHRARVKVEITGQGLKNRKLHSILLPGLAGFWLLSAANLTTPPLEASLDSGRPVLGYFIKLWAGRSLMPCPAFYYLPPMYALFLLVPVRAGVFHRFYRHVAVCPEAHAQRSAAGVFCICDPLTRFSSTEVCQCPT
jgi:hypothetical protein